MSIFNPQPPTGSSSGAFVNNEIIAGSGTSWTLSSVPVSNTQQIYANGQRLTPTIDYSIVSQAITTVGSWTTGTLLADYETSSSSMFVYNEVVSGSGTTFTLSATPVFGTQHVFAIGQRLTPTVDYTISGTIITTIGSWNAGDILADYQI